jgi:hypothetical protein
VERKADSFEKVDRNEINDRAHLMEEGMWATFEDYEGSRVGRGKGDWKAVRGQ